MATTQLAPIDVLGTTNNTPSASPKSKRVWPLALGIATAAVLIVVGSFLLNDRSDATEPLPSPAVMLGNSFGKATAPELVDYWQSRATATPQDVVVLTQLADAHMVFASELGDMAYYESAQTHYETALGFNPNFDSAILGLSAALSAQHNFAGAGQLIANHDFKPSLDNAVRVASGDAAFELGNLDQARLAYTEAAARTPGEPSIVSRNARVAYLTGDTEQAVELAEQALRGVGNLDLRPADAAFYWFNLANYQWRAGDNATALANLDNALAIFPEHLGALEMYGHVLVSAGRIDEAIISFEGLVEGGGAADLHGELEKLYTHTGQLADAARHETLGLEAAAVQVDEFVAERRHMIDFYADHDRAIALELAELDYLDRQDIFSADALAWTLHLNGRSAEAALLSDEALSHSTLDPKLHYHAGMIALANGDEAAAKAALTTALDINPSFDIKHAPIAHTTLNGLS